MKILHITPELTPWSKAGGLGDAAAGLVKAIADEGHEVRIATPLYGSVPDREKMGTLIESLAVGVAGEPSKAKCRVLKLKVAERCEAWFIEHAEYYGAREVYPAREDTAERAAYFGRAALDACLATGWIPDVIHCHDWTTGLVPVLLNTTLKDSALGRSATVLTIHNLQHQGLLSRRILAFLKLPESLFHADQLECFGGVNYLKGGILHATRVTTVSPTYAKEIQTSEYGFGLDDVVRRRSKDLDGILNGVDRDEWDPATDSHIAKKFSAKDIKGKADCKLDLQKQLNLKLDAKVPLIGVVSRLWDQKGLDLAIGALPKFLRSGKIQFALLGSGDAALENNFKKIAEDFPHAAAVRIGYDNGLSHRIEAGADFFLMPSRFEPCGLNQLYSMTYGTIPIVRATGGLADTVKPWSTGSKTGTGIVFNHADTQAIEWAIGQAIELFHQQKEFSVVRLNGMKTSFTWKDAAASYISIYDKALKKSK
jgi:starch synthase